MDIRRAIDDYIADYAASLHPDIAPDGREAIAKVCRDELLDFSKHVGNIDASALGPEHVSRYVSLLDAHGLEQLYKEIRLDYVRKFCAWLVRKRVLRRNPVPARLCGSWWRRTWIREAIRLIWPRRD